MLHVPGGAFSFGAIQSDATGRPAAAQGTSLTPTTGSKGSWTQVFSSLANETYGLLICVNTNTTSAASRNTVIDIGIGGAGSEIVLVPDLIGGNAIGFTTNGGGLWYYFPVFIPAGTRVAVRAQSTVTTSFRVHVQAMQQPLNPAMVKAAGFVEAIGASGAAGTAVTAGTTSDGSWTLLGTTARECWWWQVGVQVSSADTTHQAAAIHIDLAEGDGTNFNILMDSVPFFVNSNEGGSLGLTLFGCEKRVPAGREIYARAQCSTTPDPYFITAYGAGG